MIFKYSFDGVKQYEFEIFSKSQVVPEVGDFVQLEYDTLPGPEGGDSFCDYHWKVLSRTLMFRPNRIKMDDESDWIIELTNQY